MNKAKFECFDNGIRFCTEVAFRQGHSRPPSNRPDLYLRSWPEKPTLTQVVAQMEREGWRRVKR